MRESVARFFNGAESKRNYDEIERLETAFTRILGYRAREADVAALYLPLDGRGNRVWNHVVEIGAFMLA